MSVYKRALAADPGSEPPGAGLARRGAGRRHDESGQAAGNALLLVVHGICTGQIVKLVSLLNPASC